MGKNAIFTNIYWFTSYLCYKCKICSPHVSRNNSCKGVDKYKGACINPLKYHKLSTYYIEECVANIEWKSVKYIQIRILLNCYWRGSSVENGWKPI